ncbi:MAG: response regulator [Ktedonobacterales bacterium]
MSGANNGGRPGGAQQQRPAMAVLFIDPDAENAERLSRALRGVGAVAVVPTAQAAAAAMGARMPNLVVLELDLPDASGLDFITHLHGTPATRNVLIMVVTSRTSVRDKISAFQAGADDYLVKPVDPQQFAVHVQLLSRFRQVIGYSSFS